MSEKKSKAIPCWLTDQEVKELDQACERAVRAVPGARLTRSAYLAELLRANLKQQSKDQAA